MITWGWLHGRAIADRHAATIIGRGLIMHVLFNCGIPGDGTGGEVIRRAKKSVGRGIPTRVRFWILLILKLGGEYYLRTGEILPDSVLEDWSRVDAIYPRSHRSTRMFPLDFSKRVFFFRLRVELVQYAISAGESSIRVWILPQKQETPEQIDFLVVRRKYLRDFM